jgi:integrase
LASRSEPASAARPPRRLPPRRRQPLGDFRKAWAKACAAASLPALLFHDRRRSAARNLVRAGVDHDVARKITGQKTVSMFSRYDITDTRDHVEALRRVGHYLAEQSLQAKVASIGDRP